MLTWVQIPVTAWGSRKKGKILAMPSSLGRSAEISARSGNFFCSISECADTEFFRSAGSLSKMGLIFTSSQMRESKLGRQSEKCKRHIYPMPSHQWGWELNFYKSVFHLSTSSPSSWSSTSCPCRRSRGGRRRGRRIPSGRTDSPERTQPELLINSAGNWYKLALCD